MSIATGEETPVAEAVRMHRARIEEAGRKALEFKAQGFHCSESVFLAINDTLKITDPRMVRAITGFHGGGGTHRLKPNVALTPLLADIAAGTHKGEPDELPVVQVQHLCGGLAAGIVCMGLLFGRSSSEDDLTCVDELCYELHRRFQEELGHNECHFLREIWVPRSEDESCAPIYRQAAEIAVDIILNAQDLVPECPGPTGELARWDFAPRDLDR